MLLAQKVAELRKDGNMVGCSIGCIEVEVGISEIEVAIRQHKRVAEIRVEAIQKCGVIRAAGECSFERRRKLRCSELHGEEPSLWWPPERTRAHKRAFCPNRDVREVRIVARGTVAVSVAGEGLQHNCVEVCVAAAQKQMVHWLILNLSFEALRAKGQRVEIRREGVQRHAGRIAEDLLQRPCIYALQAGGRRRYESSRP